MTLIDLAALVVIFWQIDQWSNQFEAWVSRRRPPLPEVDERFLTLEELARWNKQKRRDALRGPRV